MRDLLIERAEELRRTRVPFVRATVVRAQKPTSAHAGDIALVHSDGGMEGFVGGTCAEASVREYGLRALSTNEPLLLRILPDASAPSADEGSVTIGNPCLSGGAVEIFLEPYVPPRRIVVVGDTPIARALHAFAGPLGWTIEIADGTDATTGSDQEALIVASHGRAEEPALTAALQAGVPYVALVASRRRAAAVLGALDVTDEQRARVHSPAGLDLGARSAPEIALSILAEFVAERDRHRSAAHPTRETVAGENIFSAIDPVCRMTVAAVPSSLLAEFDGSTFYFCGAGCRAAFTADPERYAREL
jgi:xanthine dehydrogenase accessory factor